MRHIARSLKPIAGIALASAAIATFAGPAAAATTAKMANPPASYRVNFPNASPGFNPREVSGTLTSVTFTAMSVKLQNGKTQSYAIQPNQSSALRPLVGKKVVFRVDSRQQLVP